MAVISLAVEIVIMLLATMIFMVVLGGVSDVVAHFFFGYSWAWIIQHIGEWLLFFVFIASPLMMAGGAVWVVLRDEYQRILQARIRKW